MTSPLHAAYDRLRVQLERLLACPVKDMKAVDQVVNELEQLQLKIKSQAGVQGNNPNE